MDIEEFRNKKRKLESDIKQTSQDLLDTFIKETGIFPISISVETLNHLSFQKVDKFLISKVSVQVDF